MTIDELLSREAANHPYPLLFATISGAHLYGFPSPDSDYDLRGVHILPTTEALGLLPKRDTVEVEAIRAGVELDLVTHDVLKFFNLLLKRNGYVLEQLYSPLIVQTSPEHQELKNIAPGCITPPLASLFGFAARQWATFTKETPHRVKPLLYVYRVLLTGIHLMRTGRIESNLVHLNAGFRLTHIDELIARKIHGAEQSILESPEFAFHYAEYNRLVTLLEDEAARSVLRDEPNCRQALNDLLVRIRLKTG